MSNTPRAKTAPPSLLACPHCRGSLDWDEAVTAHLCEACARSYPVSDGIVHFIDPAELGPQDRRFAHLYDWFSWVYPAFTRLGFALIGTSEARGPIPAGMLHVRVTDIWRGWFYCLEFITPDPAGEGRPGDRRPG